MSTDTKLTDLVVNTLTRKQYHDADLTDHGDELFVQSDHAGVSVGGNGVDALDTTNVTNCLTYIPQDIDLELSSNGTLTLKADSKLYMPNGKTGGTNTFSELVISADKTLTIADNAQCILFYNVETAGLWYASVGSTKSGTSNPSDLLGFFYNSADNKIYYLRNSSTPDNYTFSFPVAIVKSNGTKIISIDRVFNGMGYVGSADFVLPGVKGLIPDGRNADGSLKNIEATVSSVQVFQSSGSGYGLVFSINSNGVVAVRNSKCYSDGLKPTWFDGGIYATWFDTDSNKMFYTSDGGTTWTQVYYCMISSTYITNAGQYDYLQTKKAFRAVDYNDTEFIAHQTFPSVRYIDFTLPTSGTSWSAPADGYVVVVKSGNASQYIQLSTGAFSVNTYAPNYNGAIVMIICPVEKGKAVSFDYDLGGATTVCRFIYANGARL